MLPTLSISNRMQLQDILSVYIGDANDSTHFGILDYLFAVGVLSFWDWLLLYLEWLNSESVGASGFAFLQNFNLN